MSFSPQDINTLKEAKAEGLSKEQALARLAQSRAPQTKATQSDGILGQIGKAAKSVTGFLGMDATTDVFGRAIARTDLGAKLTGTNAEANRAQIKTPTGRELAGASLQTAAIPVGAALTGGASLAGKVAAGAGVGYAFDIGQRLAESRDLGDAAMPGMGVVAGIAGPVGGPIARGAGKAVASGAQQAGKLVSNSPIVRGAIQTGVEFAERVPRFTSKRAVELRDAASRAERIKSAPPPIARAISAGVDERIINTIEQADPATRAGYREIVKLAEESISTTGTLKTTARPEIVAGEAVANQYKLVDQQRKTIGQSIGEQVRALSKDRAVPMAQPRVELNDTLQDIGITFTETSGGNVTLNFGKTGFTKAQRAKINELYELATEGGTSLTPAEIHAKDRLFSQLQREARMDGMGDIRVPNPADPDGRQVSLFQAFRDVYSNTLEEVAPEIRQLNRQYRNLVTFTDEIEDTLVKSGKFQTNSRVDPSEYAQTNLRRLFSEAQSAADYRAIADELDQASRALGYEGAVPSDLARFAFEIRKVYPETTPRTGIEGVLRSNTTAGTIVDAVTNAGRADITDQQKAIREMLEYLNE